MRTILRIALALVSGLAVADTASAQILWSSPGGSAWLTGTNWTGGTAPTGTQIAQFGVNPTGTGGVGINMNGTTNNGANNHAVGAIWITNARTNSHSVGNSSTTSSGTFTLNGATINSVSNTVLFHNGGTTTTPTTLTIQNAVQGGTQTMTVALANTTNVVQIATGTGATGGTFGNTVAITSNISGTGSAITLLGGGDSNNRGGTLTLGGTNTFSGGIVIGNADGTNAGRVRISSAASLPATGNITVNANSQLQLDAIGATYGASNQTLNLGSMGLASGANINTGGLRLDAATGVSTFNPNIALQSDSGIHVQNTGRTLIAAGVISGSGFGVSKTGAGALVLSGDNAYTGATTVSAGSLFVNGNQSTATGAVTVSNTATLGGTGTVGGVVTVQSGGRIIGGDGMTTGTLNVSNVTVESGGIFAANLAASGTNSTLGLGAQSLDLKSNSIMRLNAVSGFSATSAGTYNLATFNNGNSLLLDGLQTSEGDVLGSYVQGSGASGAVTLNVSSLPTLATGDKLVLRRSGNNLQLVFTPVPEPAFLLAVCGLAVGGVVGLRKLRRKAVAVG